MAKPPPAGGQPRRDAQRPGGSSSCSAGRSRRRRLCSRSCSEGGGAGRSCAVRRVSVLLLRCASWLRGADGKVAGRRGLFLCALRGPAPRRHLPQGPQQVDRRPAAAAPPGTGRAAPQGQAPARRTERAVGPGGCACRDFPSGGKRGGGGAARGAQAAPPAPGPRASERASRPRCGRRSRAGKAPSRPACAGGVPSRPTAPLHRDAESSPGRHASRDRGEAGAGWLERLPCGPPPREAEEEDRDRPAGERERRARYGVGGAAVLPPGAGSRPGHPVTLAGRVWRPPPHAARRPGAACSHGPWGGARRLRAPLAFLPLAPEAARVQRD